MHPLGIISGKVVGRWYLVHQALLSVSVSVLHWVETVKKRRLLAGSWVDASARGGGVGAVARSGGAGGAGSETSTGAAVVAVDTRINLVLEVA